MAKIAGTEQFISSMRKKLNFTNNGQVSKNAPSGWGDDFDYKDFKRVADDWDMEINADNASSAEKAFKDQFLTASANRNANIDGDSVNAYGRDMTKKYNSVFGSGSKEGAASAATEALEPKPLNLSFGMDDLKLSPKEDTKVKKYKSTKQTQKLRTAIESGDEGVFMKKLGWDEDQFKRFSDLDREGQMKALTNKYNSYVNGDDHMLDKAMAHKVPHMAGGALATAGLVSTMSRNKGQQSNAQLYGQQQPYY